MRFRARFDLFPDRPQFPRPKFQALQVGLVMHRGLATVMLEYLQYMEESDIGDSEDHIVSSQPMYDIQVQQHNVQVHP